jgi:hypothetical protein
MTSCSFSPLACKLLTTPDLRLTDQRLYFAISRSPVQVGSPAPFASITYRHHQHLDTGSGYHRATTADKRSVSPPAKDLPQDSIDGAPVRDGEIAIGPRPRIEQDVELRLISRYASTDDSQRNVDLCPWPAGNLSLEFSQDPWVVRWTVVVLAHRRTSPVPDVDLTSAASFLLAAFRSHSRSRESTRLGSACRRSVSCERTLGRSLRTAGHQRFQSLSDFTVPNDDIADDQTQRVFDRKLTGGFPPRILSKQMAKRATLATSCYLSVVLGMAFGACGGSGTPTTATPTPTAPTLSVSSMAVSGITPSVGATSQFTASATLSSGATQNISSQATWQSSSTAVVSVSSTGLVTGVSIGEADVRATYQGVSGSQHVNLVGPALSSFTRDYIQAIFLGSGPLSPTDGNYACDTGPGFWTGFPRGTVVTLRVSTTESQDKRQAIQQAAAQVSSATQGAVQVSFQLTDDPNPTPGMNEATSTTLPNPSNQGCPSDNGCTMPSFVSVGVLKSSRAVQPPSQTPNAYAHDIVGHGIIGMCHIDGNLIGGPGLSLMSGGPNVFSGQIALQLTPFDLAAAQAVYGSGLNPGATKADFIRAGLINSSTSPTSTSVLLSKSHR